MAVVARPASRRNRTPAGPPYRCDVFEQESLVERICELAGEAEYLFLGGVNRLFHRVTKRAATPKPTAATVETGRCVTKTAASLASPSHLDWALRSGLPWTPLLLARLCNHADGDAAALALLQLATAPPHGRPPSGRPPSFPGWETLITFEAARRCQVAVLEWAAERGLKFDATVAAVAAAAGHLPVLDFFLRRRHLPRDEGVCAAAARAGRLDTLRWAVAHNFPWSKLACFVSPKGGSSSGDGADGSGSPGRDSSDGKSSGNSPSGGGSGDESPRSGGSVSEESDICKWVHEKGFPCHCFCRDPQDYCRLVHGACCCDDCLRGEAEDRLVFSAIAPGGGGCSGGGGGGSGGGASTAAS